MQSATSRHQLSTPQCTTSSPCRSCTEQEAASALVSSQQRRTAGKAAKMPVIYTPEQLRSCNSPAQPCCTCGPPRVPCSSGFRVNPCELTQRQTQATRGNHTRLAPSCSRANRHFSDASHAFVHQRVYPRCLPRLEAGNQRLVLCSGCCRRPRERGAPCGPAAVEGSAVGAYGRALQLARTRPLGRGSCPHLCSPLPLRTCTIFFLTFFLDHEA